MTLTKLFFCYLVYIYSKIWVCVIFWKLALIVLELLATVSGLDEALEWGADSQMVFLC